MLPAFICYTAYGSELPLTTVAHILLMVSLNSDQSYGSLDSSLHDTRPLLPPAAPRTHGRQHQLHGDGRKIHTLWGAALGSVLLVRYGFLIVQALSERTEKFCTAPHHRSCWRWRPLCRRWPLSGGCTGITQRSCPSPRGPRCTVATIFGASNNLVLAST